MGMKPMILNGIHTDILFSNQIRAIFDPVVLPAGRLAAVNRVVKI